MTSDYSLEFKPSALKEWKKLAPVLKTQFKKKLKQRLKDPHNQADALSGMANCYKIKLKNAGKRNQSNVYEKAYQRR